MHIATHSLFTCLATSLYKCSFIVALYQTALTVCLFVSLQSTHSTEIVTGHSLPTLASFCPTLGIGDSSGISDSVMTHLTGVGA